MIGTTYRPFGTLEPPICSASEPSGGVSTALMDLAAAVGDYLIDVIAKVGIYAEGQPRERTGIIDLRGIQSKKGRSSSINRASSYLVRAKCGTICVRTLLRPLSLYRDRAIDTLSMWYPSSGLRLRYSPAGLRYGLRTVDLLDL